MFETPYGWDTELGMYAATLTDPWGVTIQLTEGLAAVAGVMPYEYVDAYVTAVQ